MQADKVTSFGAVYWVDLSVELPLAELLPAWLLVLASGSFRTIASVKDKRKKSTGPRTAVAWLDASADMGPPCNDRGVGR
jgi:hypothetical protein